MVYPAQSEKGRRTIFGDLNLSSVWFGVDLRWDTKKACVTQDWTSSKFMNYIKFVNIIWGTYKIISEDSKS